jgi:DNA-binding response OmpR family regulator
MPKHSGADVLAALREAGHEIPVIVLTAAGKGDSRDQARALGASAFLTKPFSPLELLSEIERLLSEHS